MKLKELYDCSRVTWYFTHTEINTDQMIVCDVLFGKERKYKEPTLILLAATARVKFSTLVDPLVLGQQPTRQ